jgi:hypothetical protein
VIALSDHCAGVGVAGAGRIGRRASAISILTTRVARRFEVASHVVAPRLIPTPKAAFLINFLRFASILLLLHIAAAAKVVKDCEVVTDRAQWKFELVDFPKMDGSY